MRAIPWGVDREPASCPAAAREPGLLLSTRMHETVYDIPTILRGRGAGDGAAARTRSSRSPATARCARALERAAAALPAGGALPLPRPARARRSSRAGSAARDVYLSASRSDSTSLSLLEAMAAGALPVVSDIEGNREWVADGDGARLFACGDAAALARALEAALGDPAWAARRARATRASSSSAATGSATSRASRRAFEALAAGRPLPAVPGRA